MVYRIGLDVGAQSVNAAVLDEKGNILYVAPYIRHKGRPVDTTKEVLDEIKFRFEGNAFQLAVTGSNKRDFAKQLGAYYVGTIEAQILGAPEDAEQIICIGNSGAKFISRKDSNLDFETNNACAAGSGAYLDEMAAKFNLTPAEFSEFALGSKNPVQISSRCTVFADSDVIGQQQKGAPDVEIAGGCVDAIVRGYIQEIAKGARFTGITSFQEGVALNKAVVKRLEERLSAGRNSSTLVIPEHPYATGAVGAARALNPGHELFDFDYSRFFQEQPNGSCTVCIGARKLVLEKSRIFPDSDLYSFPEKQQQKVNAYLGFDVGSVSTNVVAIDESNNLIARSYVSTGGRPINAIQMGMQ
ncbi:hypothetical protein GF371_01050, partial [Candidatus Woesearchaeota archaeon]|nr:hypothetical protein [Candidatus Woesearchaeota archaeon]